MKPGLPWSIKGIEPDAREVAKAAAKRDGLTLGAWMTKVIRQSGALPVSGSSGGSLTGAPASSGGSDFDMDALLRVVGALIRKVEDAEVANAARGQSLEQAIESLRAGRVADTDEQTGRHAERRTATVGLSVEVPSGIQDLEAGSDLVLHEDSIEDEPDTTSAPEAFADSDENVLSLGPDEAAAAAAADASTIPESQDLDVVATLPAWQKLIILIVVLAAVGAVLSLMTDNLVEQMIGLFRGS